MKKIYRLVKNEDFTIVIKQGKTIKTESYTVHLLNNSLDHSRVGISVSTKLGHAVVRNKIKRQIRAMCDKLINYDKDFYDIIVIARNKYLSHTYQENYDSLDNLLSSYLRKQ